MIDFRLPEVIAFVHERKASFVALQFPEGLKAHGIEIAEELEKQAGCRCIILGDPCYGACDLSTNYQDVADVLIHFGHAPIPSLGFDNDVLFIEVHLDYEVMDLLPILLPRLRPRLGLISTPQHLQTLGSVKEWLESKGVMALIGKGDKRIMHAGQVLGCNVTSATSIADRVDQFLYIGSGDFHPLAVALSTNKEVLILDPLMREIRDVDRLKESVLRKRHASIALAQGAKSFGILLSTKPGQRRKDLALRMYNLIEQAGRRACIIVLDNITPEQLLPFQLDAFVSTACPRLAIDDALRYRKPMLTPVELEVALGLRNWDEYAFDSILGSS